MLDKLYAILLALAGISFGGYILLEEISESIQDDSGVLDPSAARQLER
ncbi:hypothetical protein [Rhodococcus opacus]|nr:hypothetical protein [Rhodococcus opacus]MDV7089116.1 hypothetical protein [Rhodococcus opacus]